MSTIKRLHIQGIRSFDPQDGKAQVISFFSPVTLIVGQNGCGKTSIIEALKYVITGTFPPGSDKGASFVNDPKLSAGYEVLAQVRLELTDTKGDAVQCTRRVKVVQKGRKGATSMQSLEGTIRTKGEGGRTKDITAKCADLNTEMCRFMGVSEAIINNVIFCHQEDSCWPLDEGKKVKERFDAIFNTTGYIASLKHLDAKDKDLTQKAKEQDVALGYAKKIREQYRQKKKEMEELTIKIAATADTEKKLEKERDDVVDKLRTVEEIEKKLAEFTSQVSVCAEKVKSGERQEQELKENIKEEFNGDIDELRKAITDFTQNSREKIRERSDMVQKEAAKERELDALRKQESRYLIEEGQFQKEENLNQQRMSTVKEVTETVLSLIKQLKESSDDNTAMTAGTIDSFIEACDLDLESVTPETVLKAIGHAVRSKEMELEKTKAVKNEREKQLQAAINELRSKRTSIDTEIRMKQEQISQNQKAMITLKKRLNAVATANDTLPMLADEEASVSEKIDQIEKSGVIVKYKQEIEAITKEISTHEKTVEKLSKQVDMLLQDKQKTDRISIFNRQKLQKQNDCNEITRKMEDRLQTIFNGNIPTGNLKGDLKKKTEDLKKEIKAKEIELRTKEGDKSHNEADYRQVKRELEKKERELEEWKLQVSEVLDDGDFHEKFEALQNELEEAKKEQHVQVAVKLIYGKYINKLKKKSCCPLCKRDFADRKDAVTLQQELIDSVEKVATSGPEEEAKIEKMKSKLDSFAELKPNWEDKVKLEKEVIPELKKRKSQLEEKIEANKEDIEEINETLGLLKNELSIATELIPDVTLLEQNQREVTKFEDSIQKIEAERTSEARACTTSLQDVQVELESLQTSISNKRREKEQKDAMRSRKQDELAGLQAEKNSLQAEKLKITTELQNRDALETQKRELDESNKSLSEAIVTLNGQIPSIKTEIAGAEDNKRKRLEELDIQLQTIRDGKGAFEKQSSKLNEIKKQNEAFLVTKAAFVDKQKKITECKNKIEMGSTSLINLRKRVETIKEEINAQELKCRELDDNLKLKLKREELARLRIELATKQKHLEDAKKSGGVGNQKRELQGRYQRIEAKLNESKGRTTEVKRNFAAIQKEVTETYAHAEDDYRDRLIKRTVYTRAQTDVRRFKKALDHAIMTFHSKRMESINRALKKYWRQIYKGNDIELIQIRTEDADPMKGNEKTIDLKASRKSYNYRVVMTRLGVDLDMRGRCSAGQKVLASIIIRIALAEAFSVKCGVISLDEPTTNLDDANIASLADCLALLAERMAQSKTFQLVVITHDQIFMDRLLQVDYIEYYYKVERDNRGFSTISRKAK